MLCGVSHVVLSHVVRCDSGAVSSCLVCVCVCVSVSHVVLSHIVWRESCRLVSYCVVSHIVCVVCSRNGAVLSRLHAVPRIGGRSCVIWHKKKDETSHCTARDDITYHHILLHPPLRADEMIPQQTAPHV